MSSSKSGQWMPLGPSSKFARSLGVPCRNRGNHPSGTATVRPSAKSTLSVSSVTVTPTGSGVDLGLAKVLMPRLQNLFPVLLGEPAKFIQLVPRKSPVLCQLYDGLQPELRLTSFSLNVHMRRFIVLARPEEEPVRPLPENDRHPPPPPLTHIMSPMPPMPPIPPPPWWW